jgi:cytochrome c
MMPSHWPSLAALAFGLATAVAGGLTAAHAADRAKGEMLFQKCQACHSLRPEAGMLGPSLAGLFGRTMGTQQQFRYSPAMRRGDLVWTDETLDRFLAEPQAVVRGNRMPFAGLPEKADRDDLVAYLRHATAD